MKKITIYFLLVFWSIEITCRLLFLTPFAEKIYGDDDASSRLQWIKYHGSSIIFYSYDAYHPYRGWALQKNLRNVSTGKGILNSNSKGIRGVDEIPYQKSDKKRILLL